MPGVSAPEREHSGLEILLGNFKLWSVPFASTWLLNWNGAHQPTRCEGLRVMEQRDLFAACVCLYECWSFFTCSTERMICVRAFTGGPRKVFCALSRFFPSVRFYSFFFFSNCVLSVNASTFRINSFVVYMDLLWILETADETKVEDA